MESRLCLYYAPDNASVIIRLALEEMGLPYDTRLVDRARQEQKTEDYRRINPAGLIPALETPGGTLFETAAILLWLTERTGLMAPPPSSPERGAFLSWLTYMSNTHHSALRQTFYPDQYVGADPAAQLALITQTRRILQRGLALFETLAGSGQNWFNAATPSILDCYMAATLRWMALYPRGDTDWFNLDTYPGLHALARRLDTRPAAIRVAKAEGLGPTPFSAPTFPNPPEGSPT
ncbi:glutathione S-transferase family protein [Shimia biformata]|uniref:glutathione S-transferase family protein n=1 Tax=Shimia biformata TaxID=1294299 RepID=UPI00194ED5BC|nr:glutathione S-transferase family protein [Shimia biformata]